jgi:RNA polymerase sigma-70 factor (ECF subfamily)
MITDVEMISRISNRDGSAFDLFYDRYAQIIFSLCVRILNDKQEAEDVMQEIFVQVWKQAGKFDSSRASVKTWLFTIARSRSLDRYRSLKAVNKRIDPGAGEDLHLMGSEENLQNKSILELYVGSALEQLPEEQRKVLELSYYEGLTQEEISEKLREPLGTIKSRIRSGLIRLRSLFSGGRVE